MHFSCSAWQCQKSPPTQLILEALCHGTRLLVCCRGLWGAFGVNSLQCLLPQRYADAGTSAQDIAIQRTDAYVRRLESIHQASCYGNCRDICERTARAAEQDSIAQPLINIHNVSKQEAYRSRPVTTIVLPVLRWHRSAKHCRPVGCLNFFGAYMPWQSG